VNSACFLLSQRVVILSQTVPVYDTPAYRICGSPRHNEQYPALRNRIESLINVTQIANGPPSQKKVVRMRLRCFLLRATERKQGVWEILNSVHWLLEVARNVVTLNPEVSKPVKFACRISSDNMTVQYVGPSWKYLRLYSYSYRI